MNSTTSSNKLSIDSEILLESGTNELEVLVFDLGDSQYGVNVAKVREIIPPPEFAYCPNQPPSVLGVINLRETILPLISLHTCLEIEPPENLVKARSVIVMEFNKQRSAFLVDGVEQIFRSSWSSIYPIPDVNGVRDTLSTGIIDLGERLVPMLDFESIYSLVSTGMRHDIPDFQNVNHIDREHRHVVVAEDSNFSRAAMVAILKKGGYGQVNAYPNGQLAWEALLDMAEKQEGLPDVIITDIEMPLLDGLTLTRQIKENPALRHIPVVLFSSVITPDTLHKGKQVGADDQAAKPQLSVLGELADKWVDRQSTTRPMPISNAKA